LGGRIERDAIMRALCSAVLILGLTPVAEAHGPSFGFHFGSGRVYGYGGYRGWSGYRSCGPYGYGYRSYGYGYRSPYGVSGYGYSSLGIFGRARADLYNTYYEAFGAGPLFYYHGPVGPSYYGPSYVVTPGVIAPPAQILYGPQAAPFQANNPALFEENDPVPAPNNGVPAEVAADLEPADPADAVIRKSNLEMKRQSVRAEGFGDEHFVKRDFGRAMNRYKEAAQAAPDRATPRLKLGITYCALNHPDLAAREFKRALVIDPGLPATATRLEDLFGGPQGDVSRNRLLMLVGDWVRQDIRDPDRLLVLGTLLYLDENVDQAMPFLKTSAQLSGRLTYLDPFVTKPQVIEPAGAELPPLPEAVSDDPPAEGKPQVVRPRNAPPKAGPGPQIVEFPELKAPEQSELEEPTPVGPPLPNGEFGDE
jgi:tetratricopeptide (TPR) repeat protein